MKSLINNGQIVILVGFIVALIGGVQTFGIGFGIHNLLPTILTIVGLIIYILGRILIVIKKKNKEEIK